MKRGVCREDSIRNTVIPAVSPGTGVLEKFQKLEKFLQRAEKKKQEAGGLCRRTAVYVWVVHPGVRDGRCTLSVGKEHVQSQGWMEVNHRTVQSNDSLAPDYIPNFPGAILQIVVQGN